MNRKLAWWKKKRKKRNAISGTALQRTVTELPHTKVEIWSHSTLVANDSSPDSWDMYLRSLKFTNRFIARLMHASLALVLQCPRTIRISRKALERRVLREFFINFITENPLSHVAVVTVKQKYILIILHIVEH